MNLRSIRIELLVATVLCGIIPVLIRAESPPVQGPALFVTGTDSASDSAGAFTPETSAGGAPLPAAELTPAPAPVPAAKPVTPRVQNQRPLPEILGTEALPEFSDKPRTVDPPSEFKLPKIAKPLAPATTAKSNPAVSSPAIKSPPATSQASPARIAPSETGTSQQKSNPQSAKPAQNDSGLPYSSQTEAAPLKVKVYEREPQPSPAAEKTDPVVNKSPSAAKSPATANKSPDAAKKPLPAPDGTSLKTLPPKTVAVKPQDPLLDLVERAIVETGKRRLTAGTHTPWQIVHGILAYRWDFKLINPLDSRDISAVEWMFSGQYFDNQPLWISTPYGGRGHPFTRPYAFEGHPTQFMGYMTMANIPLDYQIQTQDRIITVRDVINDAKMAVREGPEVTWTLWAVSHYEDPEAHWTNALGEPWSIERMVQIQVNEPVTSGACGGTHGLFALAYSRNIYLSTGKPLRGVWLESDQKVKRYIQEAHNLQNPDGTFSANHFQGPGYSTDFLKRITTSGHQLEWLMVALPQSKLKEPWIRNAIRAVAQDLIDNRRTPSDCGPMYHAVNALTIYRQRMQRQYLVPKRNSPIKLTERNFKNQVIPQQTPIYQQAMQEPQPQPQQSEDKPQRPRFRFRRQ